MGRVVAKDLLETESDATVTLLDRSRDLLGQAADFIGDDRLDSRQLDVSDVDGTARLLEGHDAAVGALPHRHSLEGIKAGMRAGVSIVDLVGSAPEGRVELAPVAEAAGIVVIPGCGVAPGLSNVLVARGLDWLDEAHEAVIYVGGIPKERTPPLEYQTVYALESVFAACGRPARILCDGAETSVEPLSGLERLDFAEPIGTLEAFYTDGLASLAVTMKGRVTGSLAEKTLRYPGFAERIRFLRDCGLLDDRAVTVGAAQVKPVQLLIRQLTPKLTLGPEGDILVMRVTVAGVEDGEPRTHHFELVDYFDPQTKYTAMARTTGFPAAQAARMIAAGKIPETGVRFPEHVFLGERGDELFGTLHDRGITVTHTVE
jgi:lysine 6-dehydrogenase